MKLTLDILEKKLKYKRYSQNTIKVYLHYAKVFLSNLKKPPSHITTKDAENFLLNFNYSSTSQQNQVIGAVKVFMKYVQGRADIHLAKIERPRKERKLPMVISEEKLRSSINCISNLKHKTLLSVAVMGALRVSEVINLKLTDIDRSRMMLHIKGAKGYKDRMVPLTQRVLHLLEVYYKKYKPEVYVFEGGNGQYSATSCNNLVKRHIDKRAHFHTLRHSAATILHEKGLDIATIGGILGHNSVKTTMIYTRITSKSIGAARELGVF